MRPSNSGPRYGATGDYSSVEPRVLRHRSLISCYARVDNENEREARCCGTHCRSVAVNRILEGDVEVWDRAHTVRRPAKQRDVSRTR
jgi:hypothetical protein